MPRPMFAHSRSPALAIGWQLWRRHRLVAVAWIATLLALAAAAPVLLAIVPLESAILGSILPVIGLFGFFMNALLFTDETGNLASGYPRRMFALPVATRTLVTWPMLYGTVVVAVLWAAVAVLVYRPAGLGTPVLLPALGLAATMAWLQALSWAPLSPAWLRIVAAVAVVGSLGGTAWGLVLLGTVAHAGLAAFLAVTLAAAYPLALAGVASDRRGNAWRLWPEHLKFALGAPAARRRAFRSPAEAQLWYEWRCHGLGLPLFVAMLAVLSLVLAFTVERGSSRNPLPSLLIAMLSMPVIMAGSVGPAIARMAPVWLRQRGVVVFVAIRPMTSGQLSSAKFRMAMRSVLVTWAIALVAAGLMIALEGRLGVVAELWQAWHVRFPGWRAVAVVVLAVVLGPALTWKQLTDVFPIALSGRAWLETLAAFPLVVVVVVGLLAGTWFQGHPEHLAQFLTALPWLVAVALTLKGTVVAVSFRAALRRGLIAVPDLARAGALWLALAACAVALAALLLPAGMAPSTRGAAFLGIAAFVPLARFALAPLALDWNRHR